MKRSAAAVALALGMAAAAQAAPVEQADFAQLSQLAQRQGLVPVLVDVELVSLQALQGTRYKAVIERRTAALLAELGAHVEAGGPHWSNGIGQIELYVNAQGLQILKNSSNAAAFRVGKPWWQRTNIVDSAGHFPRLAAGADKRLLSIEAVKPVATASLATATSMLNMNAAWGKGYKAAGQNIIVMDTGVKADHPFLRNAAGGSRVTVEACFGTNTVFGGVNYQSVCPSANAVGDSPLGLAGAAAPVANCSTINPGACTHGTHVAGIAAGLGGGTVPTGLQGVAPDAGIVGLQVFSFDASRVAAPQAFNADILAGLNAAITALGLTGGAASHPYTYNLSLGSGASSQPCGAAASAVTNAVAVLKAGGVPVVAANGNDDLSNAIAWPACVPGVVKVSSVANDGVGNKRSYFGYDASTNKHFGTNLPRPANFPGEAIWVVPGGGNGTAIRSSTIDGILYGWQQGTSQAAPQVAGLYAAVKAAVAADPTQPPITVDGVSEWVRGNARVATSLPMCGAGATTCSEWQTFDRIRLPNL